MQDRIIPTLVQGGLTSGKSIINAVCPGLFMTEPNRRWATERPEAIEGIERRTPMGCTGEPEDLGPLADRCADVVGSYLGVEAPVAVIGGELDENGQRVRIDYRTERANLPVEGVALCRFGPDGELTGAFVDENRLRPDEVETFNAR